MMWQGRFLVGSLGVFYYLNIYYKSNEFKQMYRQALFILLSKYYFKYHKNKCQLAIPTQIDERSTNYMSNSDEISNIFDEFLLKTTDKKDIVKLKDIYEMVKSSDMYLNMNISPQRNLLIYIK